MLSNWASQVRNFLSIVFILTTPLETKHPAWSLWSSSHSAPKFIFGGIWSPTASLFNFGSSQNWSEWFSFIESKNYSFLECKNIFLWTVLEKHILSPLFFLIKREKNPSCIRKIFKMKHLVFLIFYHSLPYMLTITPFLHFSIRECLYAAFSSLQPLGMIWFSSYANQISLLVRAAVSQILRNEVDPYSQ